MSGGASGSSWLSWGAGILSALLVALFLVCFERAEIEVDQGPSAEARQDAYLAAARFLTAQGVPAKSSVRLEPLPPAGHLLVLLRPESLPPGDQTARLLTWVHQGGRVLAAPQKSLFSALGVVVDPESEKPPEKGWPPTPIEVRRDEPPFAVQLHRRDRLQFVKSSEPEPEEPEDCDSCEPEEDASPTVRVAPRDQPRLVETWRLAGETDDSQGVMLRFTLGEGSIALLTETDWLTNDELAEEDHAALLLAAVEREPAPLGVTLVRALDYPSLFGLIGRYGWMALVSGGLLVAAWLAKNGPRFGPLLPDPPLARRSLLEHIGASAEFLRRRRQTRALLESTRRALRRHAAARLPEGGGTPGRRQFELWASQTGVPPETLEWAMSSPAPDDPEGLSRMIQTIEEVRRAL